MPAINVQPEGWAKPKGYANGMVAEGRVLFVGGQVGWTAQQEWVAEGFVDQLRQTLENVRAVVEAAGGDVTDIARMTWYVTDKRFYVDHQREVGAVYRAVMGYHFPAMTMVVVTALVEDAALVEIEATAVLA